MTYLLDTHTFLWILDAPQLIPATVKRICEDRKSILALSIVTPWEMAIKIGLGKLDADHLLNDFENLLMRGNYTMLETTVPQVIRGGRLPSYHHDPFDRLLAAQALELRIPILSKDRVFDLYGVKRIWN